MPSIFFLIFFIHLILLHQNTCNSYDIIPKFKTMLIFGDSTADTGNNNYLITVMKSDHRPYGNNFPGQNATGRFSNGKLPCDMVATAMGIKETIPPFLDPNLTNNDLLTGVSFASAGSGYDDLTTLETHAIPLSKQPEYLGKYVEKLKSFIGEEGAMFITNNALVIVSAGVNDFVFNYYDLPIRKLEFTIDQYQDFVLNKLQEFVKEIYDLGCRWIVVGGLPPMGCLPLQMTVRFDMSGKCLEKQNMDAQSYNQKLLKILPQLESSLPGSRILYADIYTPTYNMTIDPQAYGFTETNKGCCGTGLLEAGPFCSKWSSLCPNSSEYLFFDSIHPTETAYSYLSANLEAQIITQLYNVTDSPSPSS